MEAWEANLPKLVEEDVSIVTIFEHQVRELMEDNEGSWLKYPQARQIVQSAVRPNMFFVVGIFNTSQEPKSVHGVDDYIHFLRYFFLSCHV